MKLFLIKPKNEGMCSDDDGRSKFSRTCKPQNLGECCEDDECKIDQCQNNGTCIVNLVNYIPTPRCECPGIYYDAICHLIICNIPCYHGGTVFRQRLTRQRLTHFRKILEIFTIPKFSDEVCQNPQYLKSIFGVILLLYR